MESLFFNNTFFTEHLRTIAFDDGVKTTVISDKIWLNLIQPWLENNLIGNLLKGVEIG